MTEAPPTANGETAEWPLYQPDVYGLDHTQRMIHQWARSKGWWEDPNRNVGEMLALCHSEISEALEEYRSGRDLRQTYYNLDAAGMPEGFGVELADCVIRILDLAESLGISMQSLIAEKMRYNRTRSYRHGGKIA